MADIKAVIRDNNLSNRLADAFVGNMELSLTKIVPRRGGKFGYYISARDSLLLQSLATSQTKYAYNACRMLRSFYPFAPCGTIIGREESPSAQAMGYRGGNFYLGQNIPNPAANEATIPLFVPDGQEKMFLELRNVGVGALVSRVPITGSGDVEIKISLANMPSGVYFYSLVVDDKKIATKKMVVVK